MIYNDVLTSWFQSTVLQPAILAVFKTDVQELCYQHFLTAMKFGVCLLFKVIPRGKFT